MIPEDIIQWQDREVLRKLNTYFQTHDAITKTGYNDIIKAIRKPPVDIRINEEIEKDE